MREKKEKELPVLVVFARMLKEMFQTIPFLSLFFCLCGILHGAGAVLTVVFNQRLFDGVAAVAGGAPLARGFLPLLGFLLSAIFMEIANGLTNFQFEYPSPAVLSRLHGHLQEKASRVGAIAFEKPQFLDKVNKARQGIESGYMASLFALSILTFYLPYYIFMGMYLRDLSPFLIFALLLVFVPVILGQCIRFQLYEQVEEDAAPARRGMEYYEKAICGRDYLKETRLLGAYPYFMRKFKEAVSAVNQKTLAAEMKYARVDLLLRLLTISGYMGILALLVHELLTGRISPGTFAAVFAGVGMMYSYAEEIFGGILRYISRYAAAIRNYQKFMDLPEQENQAEDEARPEQENQTGDAACPEQKNQAGHISCLDRRGGISLQNVRFCYPGTEQEAIRGITLDIAPGETVAVVGKNGAGKSTLTKLILGLYKPTQGKVLIEGMDTAKSSDADIYRTCSAVFQRFQHYRTTLGENVFLSDSSRSAMAEAEIKEACCKADVRLDVDCFPQGTETMLSREFGGVDLSGGQWQRVAMARGLYRTHDCILLDEPTSAIDPLEESKVYRQFARISQNKTAVVVTHRLGAARIAERIIVLDQGRIDDMGTHEELIQRGGLYASLYREQAKWYENKG